jgi:predicted enzyme related to lactoylglutathione lyase
MFKTLRTVIYKVADLAAAKTWYSNLTGIQPYFDQPFYVGFDINGCELGLDPDMKDVQTGNQAVAYWAVDSVDDALKRLTEADAVVVQPKTNVGGTINVAILQDPFGNTLGIIEGA